MQFIASATGSSGTSPISASSTLDVQVGDILVVFLGMDGATLSSAAQSDGNNTFTILGNTTQWFAIGCGYCIATVANSTATIRATLSGGGGTNTITVLQFRPASGETIAYGGGPASADAEWGSNPTSAQLSSSGAAMFVGGAMSNQSMTSNQIGGGSPDGTVEISGGDVRVDASYRAFTTAQTNIRYVTTASDATWGAQMMYFTITTSGSTANPYYYYMNQ